MRVLLLTDTIHAGGAETFVLRLGRKLNELGVDTEVLSLNPDLENKDLIGRFPELRIHRIRLPALRWLKRLDRLLLLLGIDCSIQYNLIKKIITRKYIRQYDVFHTHLFPVDYTLARIKEKTYPHIRIVSTVHGDYSDYYYKAEKKERIKWMNLNRKFDLVRRQVDKWVVITGEQEQFFKEKLHLPANKMERFYNGFEPNAPVTRDKKKEDASFRIGMVARGVKLKGWGLLIEAFLKMPADCVLELVGIGPYIDELKQTYGSHARIHFTGFHPNPVERIADFDVFVLPSLFPYESLPTVIIEALYCGKPVIATRVGEIENMISVPGGHEQAGLLLDFDGKTIDPDQIYGFLMRYYNDRSLIVRHSGLAAEAFEKFDMGVCTQRYVGIYKEISG